MSPQTLIPPERAGVERDGHADAAQAERREWLMVAVGLCGLVALLAIVIATFAVAGNAGSDATTTVTRVVKAQPTAAAAADQPAPTIEQAKGVAFEKFQKVDPTLPAVPAGAVKKFTVDVDQHVVQVDPALAPTEAWTYTVNGKLYKGAAASPPIVVNQGDHVQITFDNGATKAMHVNMAHSIDFHSAEVDPGTYYVDVAPGKSETINFVADHPGVFMYHCATQPVLMHVGNGMAGMMVVKPRNLPPVDKELWVTQSEYYLGKPGAPADMDKLNAEKPDVVAFNGYANQYKQSPIDVKAGERIRLYVLNAGPTKWSAFHVIGTVFDTAVIENTTFHDSQTMSLAPSQGGYAEFTLDHQGNYPFVDHAFGDMVKGAAGMLHTDGAPMPAGAEAAKPAAMPGMKSAAATTSTKAPAGAVPVTMGEMFIKAPSTALKPGTATFQVSNIGSAMHQFAVVPAPVKLVAGVPDTSNAVVKGKMLSGGDKETLTADLKPGSYEFVCLMSGHYMAGQKLAVKVG
ncbi:MAG TPA: multicopper oxidase domain-containing protein [Baekduia sp.]|nr:multicopper oxidase domain-containing protein [Baekduia sp.]